MNIRWFIGALLGLLSIVAIQQHEWIEHNQQLIVRFSQDQANQSQDSLAILTAQLQDAGAVDITTVAREDGSYAIQYYSELSTTIVESLLHLDGDASTFPWSSDESLDIQIDIYEIQQSDDAIAGFNGVLRIEGKQEISRAAPVYSTIYNDVNQEIELQQVAQQRILIGETVACFTNHRAHIIPEVRAGPITLTFLS